MENKKNIWLISQYTGSPHHGMNYRGYYLAKEWVKKGHSVSIFTGSYSHLFVNFPKVSKAFRHESIEDIDYIWVKTPQYKSSQSIGRVWAMLVFMFRLFFFNIFKVKKPDVIIVSSLSLFPILNAYIWSKLLKVEFILEVRDIWPLTLIEVGGFSKYHPLVLLLGLFEKFGYKKAKYVVSVLPHAHLHMTKRGMESDKFVYIPNGISLDEVAQSEDISQEVKSLFPKDKCIIGYLGTIGLANAMDTFLSSAKALKEQKHIHFVLVGKGDEKSKLQAYAKTHKLENITFIDAVPKIQVQSVLRHFDIAYITSKRSPLYQYGVSANKMFDYMYASKPIIYAIESGKNLIDLASCGVSIAPENREALDKVILNLSSDLVKLDKMGENAKAYVQAEHTYEALAEKYLRLMENMCNEK